MPATAEGLGASSFCGIFQETICSEGFDNGNKGSFLVSRRLLILVVSVAALAVHGDQGAASLGHQRERAAGPAERVLQIRNRALGLRR